MMKHRKLAALALSVVLSITTISSMAIADDYLFEAGDAEAPVIEEFTEEYEAPEMNEPEIIPEEYVDDMYVEMPVYVEDPVQEQIGDVLVEDGDGYHVDPSTIVFYFQNWYEREYDADGNRIEPEHPDGQVTYKKYSDNTEDYIKETDGVTDKLYVAVAETESFTPATCTDPSYLYLQVTIDNVTYSSGDYTNHTAYQPDPALGHDWVEIERRVDKEPGCIYKEDLNNPEIVAENTGSGYIMEKCSRCQLQYKDVYGDWRRIDDELQPHVHNFGDVEEIPVPAYDFIDDPNIKVDENGKVVVDANGVPELADITKDGYYWIDRVKTCQRCQHVDTERIGNPYFDNGPFIRYAEKITHAIIIDTDGIALTSENPDYESAETLIGRYYYLDGKYSIPDPDMIELENCLEPGFYQINWYSNDPKPVSQEWIEVYPHHMQTGLTIEFDTLDDEAQCDVTFNDDGTYTIVNNSCYKTITYYEVYHCDAAGCPNDNCQMTNGEHYVCHNPNENEVTRVEKTVAPTPEHHHINTDRKSVV